MTRFFIIRNYEGNIKVFPDCGFFAPGQELFIIGASCQTNGGWYYQASPEAEGFSMPGGFNAVIAGR
jgi:hypothetical protein